MDKTLLNNFVVMIVMVLLQVLIFNNIMLFSVAMGYVFIYTIIRLPMSLHTNWLLTFAFLLGLVIDIFSDTAGVNTISCTILAMVKRPVLSATPYVMTVESLGSSSIIVVPGAGWCSSSRTRPR